MSFTLGSIVGLFVTVFAGGYFLIRRIRRQARREGELEERLAEYEASDKGRAKVDKIANKVDAMPGDKVRDELKKWSRRSDKK